MVFLMKAEKMIATGMLTVDAPHGSALKQNQFPGNPEIGTAGRIAR